MISNIYILKITCKNTKPKIKAEVANKSTVLSKRAEPKRGWTSEQVSENQLLCVYNFHIPGK